MRIRSASAPVRLPAAGDGMSACRFTGRRGWGWRAGGQMLLASDSARELVEDDLPEGVSLHDLGLHRLKDVGRPEQMSQVVVEGLRRTFRRCAGRTRL